MAWNSDQSNAYLAANPDVYGAVMQGQFPDAEAHYNQYGSKENRQGVPSMGGAFGGFSPGAPAPMGGGAAPAPGMANSLNQGFGEANASGAFNTIGDYLKQDPAIAQGFASGQLNASDVTAQQPGFFTTSPRMAEVQRQAVQQQQMGNIESRLRGVDSRYDVWKNSQDPRDQANLRDLINQQAGQGWAPQMYGLPATGQFAGTNQTYRPSETPQQQPMNGAFGGGNFGGQRPGGRFFGGPYNQPQQQNFGMNGNPIPRGQGTYSQMRPSTGYPAAPQPMIGGAFGGSQAGSFQRQPNMQGMFDSMGGTMGKVRTGSPMGGFQGGNMGFNQQQPNMGAFGGGQTGFLG